MMTPAEFAMEMNGISKLLGDTPPTAEQWRQIKEMLGDAVGYMVAKKIIEMGEQKIKEQEQALSWAVPSHVYGHGPIYGNPPNYNPNGLTYGTGIATAGIATFGNPTIK